MLELGSCLAMPSHGKSHWRLSFSFGGFTWQHFFKFYFLGCRICILSCFLSMKFSNNAWSICTWELTTSFEHNLEETRNERETKIMNKLKFPWKNEEEQASIPSTLKSELDSKKISIWFQFSNEFGTRPWVRLQLPEAWTQCSFIVVFA